MVIGLGATGLACARVLDDEGWTVHVVDRADGEAARRRAAALPATVEVSLGGYPIEVGDGADLVCPSPGVPWDAPELQRARAGGVPVRSEMDLVFERCQAPIIGITGTNGKTTTTVLCGAVMQHGGRRVHVGGNIGVTVIDRLRTVGPGDWLVLELSSFQLESIASPRCRLAAVLNVTPDHLDRHRTFEAYATAKARIIDAVDPLGAAVLGYDDPVTRAMAARAPGRVLLFGSDTGGGDGATVRDGRVVSVEDGAAVDVLAVDEIPLFGAHNVVNVLAAVAIGRAAEVDPHDIAAAVRGFRAVSHRLEPVLEHRGVLWVNDSKATNVDAAVTALRAFDRPIVWIGGGGSKGVPPGELADAVAARARHAVLNGATAAELELALDARGYRSRTVVSTLAEAVLAAERVAVAGDVVLLAPGYTSFDQFSGYDQRGRAFARQVRSLAGEE